MRASLGVFEVVTRFLFFINRSIDKLLGEGEGAQLYSSHLFYKHDADYAVVRGDVCARTS